MRLSTGRQSKKALNIAVRVIAPAVFWLGLWAFIAHIVSQPLYIPSPLAVFMRFWELAATERFWRITAVTLIRVITGTVCGVAAGVGLAVLTHVSRAADAILTPAIRLVRAAPVVSFIILMILWTGSDTVPVVICAMMAAPVVWQSARAGLSPDPQLLELARAYSMGHMRRVRYIYLPCLRPHLMSGILSSIGLAWKSGVAAEVISVPRQAIGSQVYYSKLYLDTPSLFAWTLVVVALSMILESLAKLAFGPERGGKRDAD